MFTSTYLMYNTSLKVPTYLICIPTYLRYTSVQCMWLQSHVEMLSQQSESRRDVLGSPRKKPCLRPKVPNYSACLPTGSLGSSLKTRKLFLFVFSSARLHIIRSTLTSSPPPHCRVILPQLHPPLECYFKDPASFALFCTLASPAFPQSVYSEIRGLSQSDIVLLGS